MKANENRDGKALEYLPSARALISLARGGKREKGADLLDLTMFNLI